MCFYCKAASMVLDTIWEDLTVRQYFSTLGADLQDLGPLVHDVFVPAYRSVKDSLNPGALALLDAQVTEDLLNPFYDRPGFREIWDQWDQDTRNEFIHEQSEARLAQLLLQFYIEEFIAAYEEAYEKYSSAAPV